MRNRPTIGIVEDACLLCPGTVRYDTLVPVPCRRVRRQLQGLNNDDRQPVSAKKRIILERLVCFPHRLGERPLVRGGE